MILKVKNKISFFVATILIISMLTCQYKVFIEKATENPYPISWDVYGYYLYLPSTFIYHDLGLQNNEWINQTREKYKPSTTFYQVTSGQDNKKVIVYNIGYSFVYAPSFFIANWLAPFFGYVADGFSKPYQLALLITALLISIIGIFMLRKIALCFFPDKIAALLILTVLIGTNYYYQATFDGVMPHNILFTINCFIIWFTVKWHKEKNIKNIFFLGLFLGLAAICRPTELIWILVPLFWDVYSKESFIQKIKTVFVYYFQIIFFGILLCSIICIQLYYFKYTTGKFQFLNAHSESFSFFDPYTIKFLFSYKKGWLVYTPIMIFGIIGFYHLYKQNKKIWLALFLFFLVNIYVASSWECWWYAASFSQRPMVETYVMMCFPMGCFLNWMVEYQKKRVRLSLFFILILLTLFNLFQIWQYKNYIIDAERMTKKYYWEVFGKTANSAGASEYLSIDRGQETFGEYGNYDQKYYKKEVFNLDFENKNGENKNIIDTAAADGKKSFLLNESIQFSPAFEKKYHEITEKSYVWVRASVWVYLTAPFSESNSCIVVTTESKGKAYKYRTTDYKNFNISPFVWTEIHLDFLTPDIRHKNDIIKAYFWNMGNKPVLIDNFKIDIFEPKAVFE
ncbi:MAG: hypothetical protein WBM13_01620 [Bacteroidia bacterium]